MENKKILVIAAHPDDEVLGCGGTIAQLALNNNEVYTAILGEGKTSRSNKRDRGKYEKDIRNLRVEIEKANSILGVKDVFTYNLPDNRFDSVDLLDVIKIIEELKNKIKPDIIFTQYENDLNIDHRVLYNAVITATRPMAGETVKEIYSFEVNSSTEWRFPLTFSPNVFFDIGNTIDRKLKAMQEYNSELNEFPHPRSLKAIEINCQNWGAKVGVNYAEAFQLIRRVINNESL